MMYLVEKTKRAAKDLEKLDKYFYPKIQRVIEALSSNPFLGEKMTGNFQGYYRVKIPPLRIIYSIDQVSKTIFIITLGFRGGIYKK